MAQRQTGRGYRRRSDSAPLLIIIISAVCMVLLMALFFSVAMRRTEEGPEGPNVTPDPTYTDTGSDTDAQTEAPQPPDSAALPVQTEEPTPGTAAPPETTVPPPQKDPGPTPEGYDALMKAVALPKGTAPDGYVDRLVFFGDSTTHGMKAYKVFGSRDTKQVWTPTSGTLALFRALTDLIYNPNTGEEQQIGDLAAAVKPEYLIMTLGVNGVASMKEDYFKADYQGVIDAILDNSPDTHLILQSIYPVAKSWTNTKSINNDKIMDANLWIAELAYENDLPYLDTYSALVGEDGYLPEGCQNGDGMHLNETGFAKIMDYVKTHPYIG